MKKFLILLTVFFTLSSALYALKASQTAKNSKTAKTKTVTTAKAKTVNDTKTKAKTAGTSKTDEKSSTPTFTLRKPEGKPVKTKEVWGCILQNREKEYNPASPVTDLCYYYTEFNCYGEVVNIPKRSRLKAPDKVRVHLGVNCANTTLTHLVISPEFGVRDSIIKQLADAAKEFDGLQIDIEAMAQRDRQKYIDFMKALKQELDSRNKNQILSVCVPARTSVPKNDLYPYRELSEICDRIFIMAYDEHWASSKPGPVASLEWSKKVVDFALTQIPGKKLVMGMPMYGRTWNDKTTAKAWYSDDIKKNMADNGVTDIVYENDVATFKYKTLVEVTGYLTDNWTLVKLCRIYEDAGVRSIGFWRLGFEDPEFWNWIELVPQAN